MTEPGAAPEPFATANPEQAAAWNGGEGEHWASNADRFETISRPLWRHLMSRDLVGPADRVLDVGCGTGASTRDLARAAPHGQVVGVDLSAPMLAVARARTSASGIGNVAYLQADAQIRPFERASFDLVVSCFGSMFFSDPVAAFTNLASALRRDGHLALLAWREAERNEWISTIRDALAMGRELPVPPDGAPSPFSLADPAHVRSILAAAGFRDVELDAVDESMVFGTDSDDAFGFIETLGPVQGLIEGLEPAGRVEALRRLREAVSAHDGTSGVVFAASAWLVTARSPAGSRRR